MNNFTQEEKRKAYNQICKNLSTYFDSYSNKLKIGAESLNELDVAKAYGILNFVLSELSILSPALLNVLRCDKDLDLLNNINLPDNLQEDAM